MPGGEIENMSGAAHREMKATITKLENKVDASIKRLDDSIDTLLLDFEGKINSCLLKLNTLTSASSSLSQVPALPGRSNDELYESIQAVREVVFENLLVSNKKLMMRINSIERRVVAIERNFLFSSVNSRKNNIEVDGIPKSVPHTKLEETVCKIFNAVPDLNCLPEQIEACHRINAKSQTTILKFKNRKTRDRILKNRKEISAIDPNLLGLGSTKIYVNSNLTPMHKTLAFNCRKLKRDKYIHDTWTFDGNVKIRGEDDKIHNINHEMDLYRLFPEYNEFSFHTDFLANAEEFEEYFVYDA